MLALLIFKHQLTRLNSIPVAQSPQTVQTLRHSLEQPNAEPTKDVGTYAGLTLLSQYTLFSDLVLVEIEILCVPQWDLVHVTHMLPEVLGSFVMIPAPFLVRACGLNTSVYESEQVI